MLSNAEIEKICPTLAPEDALGLIQILLNRIDHLDVPAKMVISAKSAIRLIQSHMSAVAKKDSVYVY